MIGNAQLRRQFDRVDFSRLPVRALAVEEKQAVLDQCEAEWNKFVAYDQNVLDRDPRPGKLDVYNHPARYQGEVDKNTLYVCEAMLPGGDPNGIPSSCKQRESVQQGDSLVRYESIQDKKGLCLRRYQIDSQQALLQEWQLAGDI